MTLGELINKTDKGTIIEVWDEEREMFSVSTIYGSEYLLTENWVKAEVDTITVLRDGSGLKVTLRIRYI